MTTEREIQAVKMKTAADVIARIRLQQILPTNGIYVGSESSHVLEVEGFDEDTQLQTVLREQKCKVCALGAMFVSMVDRQNALKLEELDNYYGEDVVEVSDYDVTSYLGQWFDEYQLAFIECAFECEDVQGGLDEEDAYAAVAFHERVNSCRGRDTEASSNTMLAIMRNIIKNKGEFKPEPVDYQKAREMMDELYNEENEENYYG